MCTKWLGNGDFSYALTTDYTNEAGNRNNIMTLVFMFIRGVIIE